MITVHCPTCEAAYNLDPARFPPEGRKLRCARCQTVWFAIPEGHPGRVAPVAEEVAAPVEVAEEGAVGAEAPAVVIEINEPAAAEVVKDEPKEEELPPPPLLEEAPAVDDVMRVGGWRQWVRGGNIWRIGAALMILVGALAGVGVVVMKMTVTPDEHAHVEGEEAVAPVAVAKVVQPPKGVVLHRVRGEVSELEGQAGVSLTVRGLLANTTDYNVVVPPMRLELLGDDGNVADMWPVSGVSGTLAAHAESAWTVSLSAPDMAAVKGWRVVFVEDVTAPPAAVEVPKEVSDTHAEGEEHAEAEGEAGGHGAPAAHGGGH